MWVNVLMFLVAVAIAVYLYARRNVGWFKARGIPEDEFIFPYGTREAKDGFQGKVSFSMVTSKLYEK